MRRLEGKTCLITGAAGGIGSAVAHRLAKEGANVALCDLAADPIEALSADIEGETIAVVANVANEDEMQAAVERTVGTYGSLDVMFNNAGVALIAPLQALSREDFDFMMEVNVYGVMVGCKVAARVMAEHGGGKIVNTCSVGGKRAFANSTVYCATKFAVRGLTQGLSQELAEDGITVNAFCPGIVDTPLWTPLLKQYEAHGIVEDTSDVLTMMASGVTLGRISVPEDVCGVAAFLASSDSDYLTGQCINVDGGIVFD